MEWEVWQLRRAGWELKTGLSGGVARDGGCLVQILPVLVARLLSDTAVRLQQQ